MNTSKDLSLKQGLAEVLINMEKYNLSIPTSNANLVISYSLDAFDTLSAYILSKY